MGWGWAGCLALLIMQENEKSWVSHVPARSSLIPAASLFGFPTGVIWYFPATGIFSLFGIIDLILFPFLMFHLSLCGG